MGVYREQDDSSRRSGGAHSDVCLRAAEPRRRFANHDLQRWYDVNGHRSRRVQRTWGQGQGGRHGGADRPCHLGSASGGCARSGRTRGGCNPVQGRHDLVGHRSWCVQRSWRQGEGGEDAGGRGRAGRCSGARHRGCACRDATPGGRGVCVITGSQIDAGRGVRADPVGEQHGSDRSHGEVQGRHLFEVATPRGIVFPSWRGGGVVDRRAVGLIRSRATAPCPLLR